MHSLITILQNKFVVFCFTYQKPKPQKGSVNIWLQDSITGFSTTSCLVHFLPTSVTYNTEAPFPYNFNTEEGFAPNATNEVSVFIGCSVVAVGCFITYNMENLKMEGARVYLERTESRA